MKLVNILSNEEELINGKPPASLAEIADAGFLQLNRELTELQMSRTIRGIRELEKYLVARYAEMSQKGFPDNYFYDLRTGNLYEGLK